MDFDFSDDQEMLRDSVRKWVDKGYDFERRRGIVKSGGFSRDAWRDIADLGLTGLYMPEAQGGMGFGPIDAMVVMEELGRGLVLEPFAHGALIAGGVVAAHAPEAAQSAWLPKIASGEALVVLAHQERAARYRLEHVATSAKQAGTGWTVTGAKSIVPVGDQADAFIVPARVSGAVDDAAGIALFLVERKATGVATRGYPTQDGARAAEVSFSSAPATLLVEAGKGFAALEHAIDIGIAAVCAEAVGLMDKLVDVTVEYMNTRKQFGVTIASFQALRHRIADVKMQLELGGIGVTEEYIAGHYFKRLTVIEMSFGDTMHQLGEVSARMQDTAGVFA